MDTNIMELDSIIESLNMDIFSIEHENFMNIMYSRHNGVVNESIIQEGFKETFKEIITKIKEAIKKLIKKVKEIIGNIKEKLHERKIEKENSYYMNKFKNILPDAKIRMPNVDKLNKNKDTIDKNTDEIKQYIEDIKKIANGSIDYENFEKYSEKIENMNYNLKNRYLELTCSIQNDYFDPEIAEIAGSLILKKDFIKILSLDDKVHYIEYSKITNDLLDSLENADRYVGQIGKKYTYRDYFGRRSSNINDYSSPENIKTDSYNKEDGHYDDAFIKMMNKYIEGYSIIIKYILTNYDLLIHNVRIPITRFISDVVHNSTK